MEYKYLLRKGKRKTYHISFLGSARIYTQDRTHTPKNEKISQISQRIRPRKMFATVSKTMLFKSSSTKVSIEVQS